MTSSIAQRTATTLAPLMRRAGFRYVFLGIENVLDEDLAFLQGARPRTRSARAAARSATRRSRPSTLCTAHGMFVVGGLIVGNPDDTRESIEANLAFARQLRGLALHPAPDAVSRARR